MLSILAVLTSTGCARKSEPDSSAASPGANRPSILLVTLDTTRADAIGPDARGVNTPAFNAIAARGRRFRYAYATAPETLPSHASMLTGLYPGGHGVHENGRALAAGHALLSEALKGIGYRTAAVVSSFALARRFGLARGFDTYDDAMPAGAAERASQETTDRAIALMSAGAAQPLFLWVHYFDPHAPYAPAEPFRSRHPARPYNGEVEAMDQQLGRLVREFERHSSSAAIVIAGDHGEGLGDHGEQQHGYLLYQSTMHVPLAIVGPGVDAGVTDAPVSVRRVFHTIADWAGQSAAPESLRQSMAEVVLGEAMKPYLEYGWQPQIMAVEGRQKAILAGRIEIYDVVADAAETTDLAAGPGLPPAVTPKLRDYPVPSIEAAAAPPSLDNDAKQKLASLGYVNAGTAPVVRKDAPRPVDMRALFPDIDRASTLFVQERWPEVVPLLRKIIGADPGNLDATLRLATAHSMLGQHDAAIATFRKATALAPTSLDVRLYLALHYARTPDWPRAVPVLEALLQRSPDRLPALEALASLRERERRVPEAIELRQRLFTLREPSGDELAHLGALAMGAGRTAPAIDAFERARARQGTAFRHDLELGVLYLDAGRLADARAALDRVPPAHRDYPLALFKRAQVSVLLNEPDRAARIAAARRHATATTRALIAKEKLFEGYR